MKNAYTLYISDEHEARKARLGRNAALLTSITIAIALPLILLL